MKKLISLIVIVGWLVAGQIAIADTTYLAKKEKQKTTEKVKKEKKSKKDKTTPKDCHHICRDKHQEGIQVCLDSGTKPLSDCIKKVNEAKKECLNDCRGD